MARLRDRLESLEEGRRLAAAEELRKRLRSVSDAQIAAWIHAFRQGVPAEEAAPEPIAKVADLVDEALGVGWEDLPDHELARRSALITDELLEMRRAGIKAEIGKLEKGAHE